MASEQSQAQLELADLPESCPVCAHTPVSPDLCKPNKAMRTTIKAFLKKREALREKERVDKAPAPPVKPPSVDSARATSKASAGEETPVIKEEQSPTDTSDKPVDGPRANVDSNVEVDQSDIPKPSIETPTAGLEGTELNGNEKGSEDHRETSKLEIVTGNGEGTGDNSTEEVTQESENNVSVGQTSGQGQMFNNSFGFDNSTGFPNMSNMNFSPADYNQMMQFMSNGGMGNMMGGFPNMMGMPGMNFDPITMSNMYGGFGGSGMNMNNMGGMSSGMNFNSGQGDFGGWNNQNTMWNASQDKFNANPFANGMGNDFGSNIGYGGYNMPQHGYNHHTFQNNQFQNGYNGPNGPGYGRGRGRGRGLGYGNRGRGGYGQAMQGNPGSYQPFDHQLPPQLQHQNNAVQQQVKSTEPNVVANPSESKPELSLRVPADSKEETSNEPQGELSTDADAKAPTVTDGDEPAEKKSDKLVEERPEPQEQKPVPIESVLSVDENKPSPIPTLDHIDMPSAPRGSMAPPSAPLGPSGRFQQDPSHSFMGRGRGTGRGYVRGGFRGRGGYLQNVNVSNPYATQPANNELPNNVPTAPKGQGVVGAPTAPKALRQGLPNTGMRNQEFSIVGRASRAVNGNTRSRSASPVREPEETPSSSTSRHRSRHHRHRSRSESEDDSEYERKKEYRRRKSSRKYEDGDDESQKAGDAEPSRSSSADSSARKSRRDRDRDRRSSHKHRSSHRSHRDRNRSRERRHRRKRSRSPADDAADETPTPATNPIEVVNGTTDTTVRDKDSSIKYRESRKEKGLERKRSRRDRSESLDDTEHSHRHRSRRSKREEDETKGSRREKEKEKTAPAEPEKDEHTLEREARNRERLLKEQQRREAMNAGRDSKGPSRRDIKQGTSGARRMSYKYEDEVGRAARIEQERESARWC
ncbi:MAG: hypothetical protein M1834_000585 [Cirrosporium novae-zelandiae]|nr:MAG: hypothetical protein M1834_000585 [Cirrosporium novae-zelandiae]